MLLKLTGGTFGDVIIVILYIMKKLLYYVKFFHLVEKTLLFDKNVI